MEAALASLHGPLDAPGGFWPAAADLFADQLHEAVLFGGGDADLERAALYAADRPADALAWLTRTRNARDDALYKARYKLIDLFTADVQRPQGGPGLAHCAAVFDECAWTCRFEHANEKVRQAAARCIRALLKRYGAAACDATKARAFVKEGLLPEVEQHKAPGGKKTGMQVARELYKLGAVVVSLNLDASEGEDRPDDASFMPWSEAAARLAKQMEAQLDKICARTAKDQKADSGPVLEGILGGMARLAATATLRDHFCANKLATYLVTILAAYRKGVYTGQSYGVPAAALRCVSRMAGQLARGVLAAASPKKRRSTDGADLCAAEAFQVLWAVAAAPPHGADRINERVDKYAAPALEGWLAALAADYTGVEWTSVFDLLAQQLQGADVLARSRHVSLALRCCGALAVALDRGNRSNRMVEAALALARRCDALGGGDDEAALGLLTLRAAALHAAAALVAAQASAAPQTGHLDDLGRVASRCLGAHIGVLARRDVSRWAHKVLVDALVAFVTCCTGRGAIAALADAARTAVACAAARHGGRRRAFNPSSGLFDDRACFAAAALWLDVFAKSPPAARVAAYDALIAAGLGLLASLDLRYDDAAADDEGRGGVVPLHPLDHELALNVTSFLERFVPGVDDASLFRRWAEPCLRDITRLSAELPKVSALYRVARVAITAADRAGAFPRPPSEEDPFLGTAQREDAAPKEDVSATLAVAPLDGAVVDVLRRYVAAVARAAPSFAFDELLAAACAVVLDAPWPLRSGQLHVLAGCCVAALRAGAAHAPTAKVALAAVETWRREQRAELAGVLADLLPEVEAYVNCLGTAAAVGDAAASSRLSDRARAKATEAASRYSAAQQHVGDAASRVLGRAALRIIAGLGGDASALLEQQADPLGWSTPNASGVDDGRIELTLNGLLDLADDADDDPGEASKDDTSKRRRRQASPPRARPRADAVVLRLDLLLPRVSAVARSKGPRQTRVAAAEALHSILLAAVGRAAKGGPDTGLDRVFARAFPAVIELAADSLAVIRTMFEMLLLQLCRWLAAKWMLATAQGEATARALLEALFDAATAQATKVSDQRDVASRALAELVKYVVKQHTKDELDALMGTHATDKSFDALGAVFARIVADVSQPHDASKRLGAAMCLQRLIRPLRDEASLVSRFGLELLRGALRAISYDDDEAAGASTGPTRTGGAGGQAREAAAHASQAAERLCLVLRHHVLKRLDAAQLLTDVGVRTKRREPRSLRHLVDWLFVEGVGATHHAFRRRCWRCVDQLVPVLDDTARAAPDRAAPSVRDFVRRTVAAHAAPWQIFDHSHDDADALEPETLQRVRRAHATLHGYSCFVSCEFLGADDVLAWTAAPCAARQSAHAAAPRPLLVVAQVLRWCRDAHGRSGATPDADALQAERCAALRHAADLLAVLLDRAPEAVVAHAGLFWGADAIGVWLGALAVPEGVCGSPRASDDVETKLPTAIAHLLRHARRLDIAAGAALPESVRAALGHAPQWRLAQGDAMAVEGMGLQGAAENDDGDDDAHAVGALRVYAALRDARVEEYALGGVARVRAVGALLAQRFLASAERQRLARPIETHASRRFASKTLDLALDLGLEVCARLATNDAGSNNAGELAGSSLLGLLLAASDGGGVAALERRPDAIFAALVLRESWPTVAVAISTAVRCRSEALAMHLLRGALDWGAAHGVDRALLLAPLLGGEAPSSTDATRQPGALASTYRFFLASTYRDFGLVEVLLGLAPPLDARFAPLRLCVFSVVLKALTAALDDDDCVVGEAMDFDDADDDATQERRDAAACAATRLAAHFLPGFTLGAPDMPALATVGVAAAAKRPRGDAPRGEDATQAAADQAAAADVALRSRLATVFPADHDELVRSGAAAAQRRYALQLAAVADAYAATAAPQLLTQLTPQLNQLDEPHFFAAGLRRALRGALKAAAADRRGGLAGLLVDALERCGVCDRGARQRGWALPRKTGPSTVAALSKCIVAPGLERAQSQALVDVALAEVLGPAAAGQPKKKRGLDDGPTQALICSAVAAICDIGAMPYDALNAALLFVEALFDGLDGLCGDADDALSAAVADAFAAHSVACGPEERASAKAAARKLRNVTLQAAEVRLKAAGPTDDSAVRGANCAFLRFYIHVGCKTQSKPGIVARICFSLKDEQPWLDCINAVPQLAPAAYSLKVDADFTLKRRFAAADDESPLDAVQLGRFAHLSDFAKMMLASSTLGHSQAASQAHAVSTSGDESDFPLSQGGAVDDDDAGLEASSVAPPVLNEEEDEFELNDVNRHPCMGPLVDGTKKLLDFEFDKATRVRLGLADVAAGETSQAWLPALAARLANAAGNAAVFLVQFVLNVDGLKRYAATLRPAFVRALARHVAPASAQGVDHLLRDAVMLLSTKTWSTAKAADDEERGDLCAIASELVRKAHYAAGARRAKVVEANMFLLFGFVVAYRAAVFDHALSRFDWAQATLDLLGSAIHATGRAQAAPTSAGKQSEHARQTGLFLVRLVAMSAKSQVEARRDVFTAVLDCAAATSRVVHRAGAECAGILLKQLDVHDWRVEAQNLALDLEREGVLEKKKFSRFAALIAYAARSDVRFFNRRLALRALDCLTACGPRQRAEVLEALAAPHHAAAIASEELFECLHDKLGPLLADATRMMDDGFTTADTSEDGADADGFKATTKGARPLVQLNLLRLVLSRGRDLLQGQKSLGVCEQLVYAMGPQSLASSLHLYQDQELRAAGYELLMAVHDACDEADAAPRAGGGPYDALRKRTRAALLAGLADADADGMLETVDKRAAAQAPRETTIVDSPGKVARREAEDSDDDGIQMLTADPNPKPRTVVDISHLDDSDDEGRRRAQDAADAEDGAAAPRRGIRRTVYDYWHRRFPRPAQRRLDALLRDVFPAAEALPHRFAALLLLAPSADDWDETKLQATSLCDLSSALDVVGQRSRDSWAPALSLEAVLSSQSASQAASAPHMLASQLFKKSFGAERSAAPPGMLRATQGDSMAFDQTQLATQSDARAGAQLLVPSCFWRARGRVVDAAPLRRLAGVGARGAAGGCDVDRADAGQARPFCFARARRRCRAAAAQAAARCRQAVPRVPRGRDAEHRHQRRRRAPAADDAGAARRRRRRAPRGAARRRAVRETVRAAQGRRRAAARAAPRRRRRRRERRARRDAPPLRARRAGPRRRRRRSHRRPAAEDAAGPDARARLEAVDHRRVCRPQPALRLGSRAPRSTRPRLAKRVVLQLGARRRRTRPRSTAPARAAPPLRVARRA
ncbi:hypothetical protein M885DRAFT_48479 [Pelagophyceae sp. CCMP2097]|nr:hypothetical protein M885DRAFT_48479 [Pelagophyceae sp. CCMP2097]